MKRTSPSRNCSMKGIILLILALTPPSLGQRFSFGSCQSLQSFASTQFYSTLTATSATFNAYAISPSLFFHQWNCLSITTTQVTAFVTYTITATGVSKLTGSTLNAAGTLTISGHLATGAVGAATATTAAADVFTFTLSDGWKTYTETFYLLDVTTDYIVFYGCENYGFGKKESAIVFVGSGATITPTVITPALNALAARGYPLYALRRAYVGCT